MLIERHQELLEARGLDVELLVQHGVVSSAKRGRDWIAIPYFVGDDAVNHKYRTISGEKRFSQDNDGRCVFWNTNIIADESLSSQPLIITEGEFDAFAAIQAGFARVVSVPNGAPANPIGEIESGKYAYLNAMDLRGVKEIILATDDDPAGNALRDDLALRLGRARCKFLRYPQGCKDLCDVLARYAERGVVETMARAQWLAISGVYKLSDLPALNPPVPLESGFPGLDNHYRLRIGDFCVVTGTPGRGKTTFTRELACLMASNYRWKSVIASFEAIPQIDHRRSIRSWYSGNLERDLTSSELAGADNWIDDFFRFIVPEDDEDVTLDWVIERVSSAAIRDHVKLAIIDPWNEMDHERPRDMSLTEYVGAALRRLKRMARTLGIHLIVAAHPAKLYRNKDGNYPVPTLYDISDSAMWANRPDIGVVVDRPDKTQNRSVIQVVKSRFADQIGTIGESVVRYNGIRYEVW